MGQEVGLELEFSVELQKITPNKPFSREMFTARHCADENCALNSAPRECAAAKCA